jgi:hypothetical protein
MRLKLLACCAALSALAAGAASAAVIPTLEGVVDNGTDFTFTYQGTLSADAGLDNTSRLVIFDFLGYVDGSVFSPFANVVASTELVTLGLTTIPGQVDDPTLQNLVFRFTGAPFRVSGGPYAEIDFTGLSARSIFGGLGEDTFAAITVKNNPDNTPGGAGTPIFDQGFVTVPAAQAVVPEPAAWALMIMGFGAAGAMLRRRREMAGA